MMSPRQIKAARALAGWSAEELGAKANLTADTIANIETGRTQAREGTLERIAKALDTVGVEFTENEGVRRKPTTIEIFEGIERFNAFYDFLYQHLKLHGGEVCVTAVDEGLFSKYRVDPEQHRKRMKELVDSGKVSFRILAAESKFKSSFAQFKRLPKGNQSPTSFYAFGNCLALISFDHTPAPYVVLHKSGPFAEAYRQSFNIAWNVAQERPKGEA